MSDDFGMQVYRALRDLRHYALKLTRDPDRRDDLIQTAFVKALENRHQFTPGTNLGGWLLVIIRNTYFTESRRKLRTVMSEWSDAALDVADPRDTQRAIEARFAIQEHLATLTPRQREAVTNIAGYGYSYREAAEIIGIPPGTVKSRLNRARYGGN